MIGLTIVGCQSKNSCPEGVVDETYVHRYGVQVDPEDWSSRGKHGKVISKMADGVTVSRFYSAGELDGDTTYTFPHSEQIEIVHTYSLGTLVRELVNYRSGNPKKEMQYIDDGRRQVVEWYEDGSKRFVEEYEGDFLATGEYYNGKKQIESRIDGGEGVRKNRDQYGQLESADEIQDGELTLRTTFHPNGGPMEMIPFQNGKIQGQKRTYHPGGEPYTIEEWVDGEQHGDTVVYENGELKSRIVYQHGRKHGVEQVYRDGAAVVERVTWKDDELHGPRYQYVGDNTNIEWHYHGRKVNKNTYDRMSRAQVR